MHFSVLFTTLGVASLVVAVPAKKDFSIKQIKTGKLVAKPAPAVAMAQVYMKYGAVSTMPQSIKVAAAAASSNDGTASASPASYDAQYLTPVQIGTPAQTLMLDFDTGSSDLWTFSTLQPANQTANHDLYDPAKSSTSSKMNGATWRISYGDGSGASGDVYTDTVSVGATKFSNQAVEAARSVSSSFVNDASDGLLGLVRPTRQKTFFDNVAPSLSNSLFTVLLKKGAPGSYDFGFIDSSKYTGSITYVPADGSRGYWGFSSNGYAIGSGAFNTTTFSPIADTGTSLMLLPSDLVASYWSQNGGTYNNYQGGYIFPCSTTLKSLTIGIGGYKAVVPGSYMNYAPIGYGYCFGGLQSNTGMDISILGDVFLKSQFVVFSSSGPQIGFAPQASGQSSSTAASPTPTATSIATQAPIPASSTATTAASSSKPASSGTPSTASSSTAPSSTPSSTTRSLGCYTDLVNNQRTYTGPSMTSDTLTNAVCQSFCNSRSYRYSATEYARECYCSTAAPSTAKSTNCNMKCTGDAGICGGPNALSVLYFSGQL